jgi:Helix-turn-helix domain
MTQLQARRSDEVTTEAARDWRSQNTIKVEQAGNILGLSRASAYAAAGRGEIPTLRIGRRLIVPTHALRRMLGEVPENESRPADEPGATKTAENGSHGQLYKS